MFFTRLPFLVGAFLHLVLIYTRVIFRDFRCAGDNCTALIFADFPLSLVYLAFPDGVVIVFSFIVGTLLWGLYGLAFYYGLARVFKER